MVWLAVKPHVAGKVLKEVAPFVTPDHLFMSVAAGVTINTMEKVWLLLIHVLVAVLLKFRRP